MTNGHLDSDTIDRYVAGERSAAAEEHLGECARCRDAIGRVETALAGFRAGARLWSESRQPIRWDAARGPAPRRPGPARWAAVAAAALVVAAVPLYRGYVERRAEAQAKADAVLLEEVSADLSRPAPEPLEPLIQLVSQSNTGEHR